MKNKYFIGQDYNTIKEKNDILATYDDLQRSKITFLNEMYNKESTLKNLWSIYKNHIHPHELLLNKDAMFFNEVEVDEVIANRFRFSQPTKNNILHFINIYKRWGVDRGDISGNSVDAINRKESTKDMSKVLINKVWGLGEFYNLLTRIETKSLLSGTIPMLLARYGIAGKQLIHMRSLKWEDIDYEKKQVKIIEHGQLIRIIDVDDRFLEWIDKYKASNDNDESIDYGYVLKKKNTVRDDSLIENYNTINSRMYKACREVQIDRISFGDLQKSRCIDLLLEMRATRKLTTDDFEWVLMSLKEPPSPMAINVLREYYEALTKDTVIFKRTTGIVEQSLKETNSKAIADKIRKAIKFEEFINDEEKWENKGIESEVGIEVNIDAES